jgi:hypothetical protein
MGSVADPHAFIAEISYHYTDAYGSRINHEKIFWFVEALDTPEKRLHQAQEAAKIHYLWKIQAHQEYQAACRAYIKDRIAWEYQLLKQTVNIHEMVWRTTYDKQKILRVTHATKIISSVDVRDSIENDEFC